VLSEEVPVRVPKPRITAERVCLLIVLAVVTTPFIIAFWPKGPHWDRIERNPPSVLWLQNNSLQESFAYSVATADIDGDGSSEVIVVEDAYGAFGETTTRITVRDGRTGLVEWFFEENSTAPSGIALGDIDDDSLPEIVFGLYGKGVFALNGDGSLLWNQSLIAAATQPFISPSIADILGDQGLEVIIPTEAGSLYVLNGLDGSIIWSRTLGGRIFKSASVGDIDGDMKPEIVVSCDNDVTFALNSEDGSELWNHTWPHQFDWLEASTAALGDINSDGIVEVIIRTSDYLAALSGEDGTVVWSFQPHLDDIDYTFTPALGDVNGDGQLEIVFTLARRYVYALHGRDGSVLWAFDAHGLGLIAYTLVGDFDGDNRAEVVITTYGSSIISINGEDASIQWTSFMNAHGVWGQYIPGVGDVNDNGMLDIVVPCYGYANVYAIEPQNSGKDLYWQALGGTSDYSNTYSVADIDSDFDGLTNEFEASLGTNSTSSDSDKDGISDAWEYHHGYDPTDSAVPLQQFLSYNSLLLGVTVCGLIVISSAILIWKHLSPKGQDESSTSGVERTRENA
jgi:outer membrane protein assembly factor BamB